MRLSERFRRVAVVALVGAALVSGGTGVAADWRSDYPVVTVGVITAENESDRLARYEPVLAYFKRELGVDVKWRSATSYAGVIEGLLARKVEIARFGPASYAQAWIQAKGAVVPLVGELDRDGDFGYHSVVVVKSDSPYQSIQDLRGKRFAFADPNSTSGHQAPRFFLNEAGIDADVFFSSATFSGSHENSITALLNGTFDAVATWWRSDERSNMTRMESKGMIAPGQWRVIWTSPKLPSSPWAMGDWMPQDMRDAVQAALVSMRDKDPNAWKSLTDGQSSGYREVTHADYEAIVRMIEYNLAKRRAGS